jgi:putative ABC transport system permease protein
MRWRSIPRAYWRRLKIVLVPELLALLGISIGVALLFASQVAGGSLASSESRLATSVLGSVKLELQARSPHGMDESTLRRVRTLQGVSTATPVLEASADARGSHGSRPVVLVGVEPHATHLGSAAVQKLSNQQLAALEAVALPEDVASAIGAGALHPVITLQVAGQEREARVGLEVRDRESALIANSPLVVAPLGFAQSLTGMNHRVTRIFLTPKRGQEARVRRELRALAAGKLNVRPADFDATLFGVASAPIDQSTTLFSAVAALVGAIFALYAMLLTVGPRQAFVALLRELGYRRRQVVRILVFDALVLGVLSAVVGFVLGELVSRLLLHANPGYLVYAFPIASQRQVSLFDVALAVAAAMLAAFVGAFAPAREIFGHHQRRAAVSREHFWRLARNGAAVVGVACVAATTMILYDAPQLALYGMASLTLAVLMLLPMVLHLTVRALTQVRGKLRREAPLQALTKLLYPRHLLRSLAIAATGAVAVFGSVSIGAARQNLRGGLNNSSYAFNSYGEIWVQPSSQYDLFTTMPLSATPTSLPSSLRTLPGVRSVAAYDGSYLDIGTRRTWVLAPPADTPVPISPTQLLSGSLTEATRRFREGGIAVSQAVASEHHLHVGGYFMLPSPVPTRLRVAAISTNMGWSAGALIIPSNDYAHAWGSSTPSAYLVSVTPGANVSHVETEIRQVLGPKTGLAVETISHRVALDHVASGAGLSQLSVLSWMVLIAAVLTMAVAMTTMLWQRRGELAEQQGNGSKRTTQVLAMLLETAVLLGTGCLTGALAGIYGQILLSHALATVTGFPVVYSTGAVIAAISCGAVTAAAVAAIVLPGYAATRVPLASFSTD